MFRLSAGLRRRAPSPEQVWAVEIVAGDISHEGLRMLLREEGVTFQRIKTWKASKDPHYAQSGNLRSDSAGPCNSGISWWRGLSLRQ
jgi:hypothetical protein